MKEARGRGRSVAALSDTASIPEVTGAERDPGYAALGEALAARKDEILRESQGKYLGTAGSVEPDSPLWNITSLATLSIVRWLQTGETADPNERSKIASLGEAAAQHRDVVAQKFAESIGAVASPSTAGRTLHAVPDEPSGDGATEGTVECRDGQEQRNSRGAIQLSVTMLTKLNFWWRDATCRVLAEEAQRLSIDDEVRHEATAMVMKSCTASLVNMAKRFDAEIEALHQRLSDLALHDPLTGLVNRTVLIDQLDQALARLSREPPGLALLFVDVDNFKAVNDVYGHACGDAVLTELGSRLRSNVRGGDVVARLGGDEFVLLIEGLSNPALEAQRRAEGMRAAAAVPMSVTGNDVRITVSIGVVTARLPGKRSEDVLGEADAAMYSAKRAGRNRVALVQIDDGSQVVRFATTSDLHRALEHDELHLVYQPLYDCRDGTVLGFEALLRWEHPEKGTVLPLEFIPIAEESGLMVPIGEWVLEEACRQAMEWAPALDGVPRMAVNVSARQIVDRDFVRRVASILERTGMPPSSLLLELTESALLAENGDHEATLSVLKDLGVQLAIDDFGTGYSSLAYLRRFPVDQLKVDRTFVKDVAEHGDIRIMQAVVRLAHDLGLEVVAEGVETSAELSVVQGLGCDVVQGYLLGRPVPSAVELEHRVTPLP